MICNCPSCGKQQNSVSLHCVYCGSFLVPEKEDILTLKEDLKKLKNSFEKKVWEIERRIHKAELRIKDFHNLSMDIPGEKDEKSLESPKSEIIIDEHIASKNIVFEDKNVVIESQIKEKSIILEKSTPEIESNTKEDDYEINENVGSFIIENAFEPLAEIRDHISGFYNQFKREGKLPVFFMTIGGIIAVLLGLGLLMQFVSDTLFEIIKNVVTLSVAFAVVYFGAKLTKKDEKYEEFGAALLGLGVSINYLVIYFQIENPINNLLSSYYLIFTLIIINTFWAVWLALKYETKVVAVISLVGGSFAPFFLSGGSLPVFYFAYLWVLCASSIYITFKINWKPLAGIAFVVVSFALGESVLSYGSDSLFNLTIVFHLFAYLFIYYSLFDKTIIKSTLKKGEIIILTGALSLLLTSLFFLFSSVDLDRELGFVYLFNSLVFVLALVIMYKSLSKSIKLLYFIIIGTFIGVSIPVLLDQQLMGVFWALEGLALVYIGFIFSLPSVRKEGFVVLLIAVIKIATTFEPLFDFRPSILWESGFINLLLLGLVFLFVKVLLNKNSEQLNKLEQGIGDFVFELISVWLIVVLFKISDYYLGDLTFNLAIIPMYAFIWWGNKNRFQFTEWLGFSLYFLVFIGFLFSASEVDSFSFREQTILGKAALVELYLNLWFLLFFYQKVLKKESELNFIVGLRRIFYFLMPLLFIPSTFRYNYEYLPVAFWVGALICFVLYQILKLQFLLIELYILVIGSSIVLFTNLTPPNVGIGVFVLLSILIYKKGYLKNEARNSVYKQLFSYFFYYLGFAGTLLLVELSNGINFVEIGVLFPSFYFILLVFSRRILHPLRENYMIAYGIAMFTLFIGCFMLFFDPYELSILGKLFFVLIVIFVHYLLYNKRLVFPKFHGRKSQIINLFILHIYNILLYTGLISWLSDDLGVVLTIALVFHAIILLFNAQKDQFKQLMKFSIGLFILVLLKVAFKDMEHFSIQEKIVSFLIIGVLLLGGGLVYLRLGKKEKSINTIHEREQEKN